MSRPTLNAAAADRRDEDVVWHRGHVSADARRQLLGQDAATVWLTGLSGAGKSRIDTGRLDVHRSVAEILRCLAPRLSLAPTA